MKNKFKIALYLTLSGTIFLGASNSKFPIEDFSPTITFASQSNIIKSADGNSMAFTIRMDENFVRQIDSVEVNGSKWIENSNSAIFNSGKYYLNKGDDSNGFGIKFANKFNANDKIVIKSKDKKLSFTIKSNSFDSFSSNILDQIIDKESILFENIDNNKGQSSPTLDENNNRKNISQYLKNVEVGFLSTIIRMDDNFIKKITDLEVNGEKWKESPNSAIYDKGNYYLIKGDDSDGSGIKLANKLNANDKVLIKTNDEELSFTIGDPKDSDKFIASGSLNIKKSKNKSEPNQQSDGNGNGKENDDRPKENKLVFKYMETFGYYKLKLADGNKIDKEKIGKIIINGKVQTETSSPLSIFGKGNFAFSKEGDLCIERLNNNDSISITYDDQKYNYIYQNKKLIANENKKDVIYKIRLVGDFDSLLVGQRKIDGFSGGSVSVSNNPNAVNVEYTEKEEPKESDWKKLEDRGNEFRTIKAVISDSNSGIEADFAHGSISLGGSPTKAGLFKIKIEATDIRGNKIESNEVPIHVHNLGDDSLEDLLTKAKFIKTQDGKSMWEMCPWKVTKFNDSNLVSVPKDLKAWFGSHTSGTYGELGVESLDEPYQTLVVGQGANLTFKNMKIMGSVKIVVKDGGVLNLDDSVVFGKIEVSNGGKLNVNYNPHKDIITTGASIWGQVVLKDGAILGTSSIYSNTNYAAQGKLVNINNKPVIKVEGNAKISGQVSVRGDEQATKGQYGQPALEIGPNANLEISEGSSLNLFGGGAKPLTSVGGDALKLNGGSVSGKGRLVAVAGSGYGKQGGFGVSGQGTISVDKAYIRGGNSSKSPGKALQSSGIKFINTKGISIDGKVPSKFDPVIPEDYWNVTQKISDSILNTINKSLEDNKDKLIGSYDNKKPEKDSKTENTNKNNNKALDSKSKDKKNNKKNLGNKVSKTNDQSKSGKNKKEKNYGRYLLGKIPTDMDENLNSPKNRIKEDYIRRLEEAIKEHKIAIKAAEFLLENAPKQVAPVKDKLIKLIYKGKIIIEKSENLLNKINKSKI